MKKTKIKSNKPQPRELWDYVYVETIEGSYYRRRRGTVGPAKLNEALQKNAALTARFSMAAKRIRSKLHEYTVEMKTGRFIARVSGCLVKAWNKYGRIDYSFLKDYELQPYRPVSNLLPYCPTARVEKNEIRWTIPVVDGTVNKLMPSITGFYFELVLLSGDPDLPNGLRIQSDESPVFGIHGKGHCDLCLPVPAKTPWMTLIKITCMEGKTIAKGDRYNVMRVVAVG